MQTMTSGVGNRGPLMSAPPCCLEPDTVTESHIDLNEETTLLWSFWDHLLHYDLFIQLEAAQDNSPRQLQQAMDLYQQRFYQTSEAASLCSHKSGFPGNEFWYPDHEA